MLTKNSRSAFNEVGRAGLENAQSVGSNALLFDAV